MGKPPAPPGVSRPRRCAGPGAVLRCRERRNGEGAAMTRSGDGVERRGLLTAGALGGMLAATPGAAPAKPGGSGGAQRLSTPPEAIVETRAGKVRGCVRDGGFT